MAQMKLDTFIAQLKLAASVKTLYIKGCFGAPMNDSNKKRYSNNCSYNRNRASMINKCTPDTFGFDCVCLIKGILWGWNADKSKQYGGASYGANGVPDCSEAALINSCPDKSTDFTRIQPGEVVWMSGHVGVYIGEGQVIECSPSWENGVQYTWLGNLSQYRKGHYRVWTKHGHMPYVDYGTQPAPGPSTYSQTQFIKEVQGAIGVSVDGIAGPQTLGATPTVSMKVNSRHKVVKPMQRYLNSLGYDCGTVDGAAGTLFDKALRAYQKDHGCAVDGEATAQKLTWKKLLGMVK